ncbi:hypothetical protein ABZ990_15005 [Streptomyces sp. NPDC046203]|uniref:hypothetical protein n=1 Tax=Streptomyces sp. NPDC046203 TaxID=3154602 RepID=UPI0033F72ABC
MTSRIERAVGFPSRPRPEPVAGCTVCELLAQRFERCMAPGPRRDESAAVDCVVEIRNHPHDPPKMMIRPV